MNRTEVTDIDITSDIMLDSAYEWVCQQRIDTHHNNSVWDVRFNWKTLKPLIQEQLRQGAYHLSPLRCYRIDNELISSWEAIDSVVLKALSLTLNALFTPEHYPHCTHLKNNGGLYGAVERVSKNKINYKHALKSDVFHYYESIDHDVLLQELKKIVQCEILLNLITQYCQRLEIKDGNYFYFKKGIPKGCPVSPLIAALYLKPLDDEMSRHGFYVRFMDDWVIMVKKKHQLRKVIQLTHRILTRLKLKMHPDKTFIGCIKKGFAFWGIHWGEYPKISKTSIENHRAKLAQRYARDASTACIGDYVARWSSWCKGLLARCSDGCKENETHVIAKVTTNLRSILENYHEYQTQFSNN